MIKLGKRKVKNWGNIGYLKESSRSLSSFASQSFDVEEWKKQKKMFLLIVKGIVFFCIASTLLIKRYTVAWTQSALQFLTFSRLLHEYLFFIYSLFPFFLTF